MKFITSVSFPSNESLVAYMNGHTYEDWPFKVFLDRELGSLLLDDITILYGNNGSGKSTILNCLAEKVGAARNKPLYREKKYLRTSAYSEYAGHYEETSIVYYPLQDYLDYIEISKGTDPDTGFEMASPNNLRLITSDDIFTKINNTIRSNNIAIDETDKALDDYFSAKFSGYKFESLKDYEALKARNAAQKKSASKYVKENTRKKLEMHSNGETAISYFEDMFEPDGLYFLDEPENCLSPIFQLELMKIIMKAKRFLNCQFIIATHSPLILSLPDALVYDLDSKPVESKEWFELENVKAYFNFFYKNKDKFIE